MFWIILYITTTHTNIFSRTKIQKTKTKQLSAKITYRDLFEMLRRDGCSSITLPINDYERFKKYATKSKMIDKLHFNKFHGAFVVTKIKT